ncbi:hypothetical protein AJ80_06942 [Polytolypa hystricis UAMH7299]|uniref:N-acetylglucosaminylphosphatidylinositol deacetylase n=1 Tax=Polytolypa hystricis (strain UAMH7299) TaxID=1447883 RepID=A0A2B7XTR4_POLH7|nr:hypothetical protein AJ80_06942 [Polytolypa hystricis UAMH7299]
MSFPISLYTLALIPAVLFFFWIVSATTPGSPFGRAFRTVNNKRICLLIAHPDDEAMFFAPTLLALTRPELGNHVKILCLSSGDADGLGHIRKNELKASALRLGLRNESDVFVVEDPSRFPDSMTAEWSATDISTLLAFAFAPEISSSPPPPSSSSSPTSTRRTTTTSTNGSTTPSNAAPTATIDILLTFDAHGVSNHPNHRSLYHGARAFLQALMKGKSGYACPVTLYSLTTTSMFRKYLFVFDSPITMLHGAIGSLFTSGPLSGGRSSSSKKKDALARRLLFVSGIAEWMKAWNAMVSAHKSQMVWFRWGWITVGRYMVVNDLKREQI